VEKKKRKPMKKRMPIADTRLYIPMEDTIATNEKIGKEKKAEKKGDYTMVRRDPSIEKLCDPVLLYVAGAFVY